MSDVKDVESARSHDGSCAEEGASLDVFTRLQRSAAAVAAARAKERVRNRKKKNNSSGSNGAVNAISNSSSNTSGNAQSKSSPSAAAAAAARASKHAAGPSVKAAEDDTDATGNEVQHETTSSTSNRINNSDSKSARNTRVASFVVADLEVAAATSTSTAAAAHHAAGDTDTSTPSSGGEAAAPGGETRLSSNEGSLSRRHAKETRERKGVTRHADPVFKSMRSAQKPLISSQAAEVPVDRSADGTDGQTTAQGKQETDTPSHSMMKANRKRAATPQPTSVANARRTKERESKRSSDASHSEEADEEGKDGKRAQHDKLTPPASAKNDEKASEEANADLRASEKESGTGAPAAQRVIVKRAKSAHCKLVEAAPPTAASGTRQGRLRERNVHDTTAPEEEEEKKVEADKATKNAEPSASDSPRRRAQNKKQGATAAAAAASENTTPHVVTPASTIVFEVDDGEESNSDTIEGPQRKRILTPNVLDMFSRAKRVTAASRGRRRRPLSTNPKKATKTAAADAKAADPEETNSRESRKQPADLTESPNGVRVESSDVSIPSRKVALGNRSAFSVSGQSDLQCDKGLTTFRMLPAGSTASHIREPTPSPPHARSSSTQSSASHSPTKAAQRGTSVPRTSRSRTPSVAAQSNAESVSVSHSNAPAATTTTTTPTWRSRPFVHPTKVASQNGAAHKRQRDALQTDSRCRAVENGGVPVNCMDDASTLGTPAAVAQVEKTSRNKASVTSKSSPKNAEADRGQKQRTAATAVAAEANTPQLKKRSSTVGGYRRAKKNSPTKADTFSKEVEDSVAAQTELDLLEEKEQSKEEVEEAETSELGVNFYTTTDHSPIPVHLSRMLQRAKQKATDGATPSPPPVTATSSATQQTAKSESHSSDPTSAAGAAMSTVEPNDADSTRSADDSYCNPHPPRSTTDKAGAKSFPLVRSQSASSMESVFRRRQSSAYHMSRTVSLLSLTSDDDSEPVSQREPASSAARRALAATIAKKQPKNLANKQGWKSSDPRLIAINKAKENVAETAASATAATDSPSSSPSPVASVGLANAKKGTPQSEQPSTTKAAAPTKAEEPSAAAEVSTRRRLAGNTSGKSGGGSGGGNQQQPNVAHRRQSSFDSASVRPLQTPAKEGEAKEKEKQEATGSTAQNTTRSTSTPVLVNTRSHSARSGRRGSDAFMTSVPPPPVEVANAHNAASAERKKDAPANETSTTTTTVAKTPFVQATRIRPTDRQSRRGASVQSGRLGGGGDGSANAGGKRSSCEVIRSSAASSRSTKTEKTLMSEEKKAQKDLEDTLHHMHETYEDMLAEVCGYHSSYIASHPSAQKLLREVKTAEEKDRTATIIFDLDETLCNNRRTGPALLRPGTIELLQYLRTMFPIDSRKQANRDGAKGGGAAGSGASDSSSNASPGLRLELIVWTASMESVARPVIAAMDPDGTIFDEVIYRDLRWFKEVNYTKDLRRLGRYLQRTVIVENAPSSVILNHKNAILVTDFINSRTDRQLYIVRTVLTEWLNNMSVYVKNRDRVLQAMKAKKEAEAMERSSTRSQRELSSARRCGDNGASRRAAEIIALMDAAGFSSESTGAGKRHATDAVADAAITAAGETEESSIDAIQNRASAPVFLSNHPSISAATHYIRHTGPISNVMMRNRRITGLSSSDASGGSSTSSGAGTGGSGGTHTLRSRKMSTIPQRLVRAGE